MNCTVDTEHANALTAANIGHSGNPASKAAPNSTDVRAQILHIVDEKVANSSPQAYEQQPNNKQINRKAHDAAYA